VNKLRQKVKKDRRMKEIFCCLEFWMLIPAYRNLKINSDKQYAIIAHETQNALRVTVAFLPNRIASVVVNSNSSIPATIHKQTAVHLNSFLIISDHKILTFPLNYLLSMHDLGRCGELHNTIWRSTCCTTLN
jgi:hypothetical protein